MPKRSPLFLGDNGPEELGDSDYLAAKAGVLFGSDTAAANVLSDYEEGDWTPTLPNGGTLTVHSAEYTKIGRQVTVTCLPIFVYLACTTVNVPPFGSVGVQSPSS